MKNSKIIVVGIFVFVVVLITATWWEQKHPASGEPEPQKVAATLETIKHVNVALPEKQVQAKMLVAAAMAQRKIPDSTNWCETLNVDNKIWAMLPTNTVFAINTNVAGKLYVPTLPGDLVLFFETANNGWNQAGGAELLAQRDEGTAVGFADGRALIVPTAEINGLRWQAE